ncbi:MAG: biotin--[acetyl-CoA-carboxylase] ligase [Candidatus Marinimicrobia bacterium]|jgi:BirA family biotin operon repressor/biotin-[acetyl-CoA-carboxylase] ligase|nr:biotin--[acetyl-CoA-carboxylase] ligase [Candidatus Neomarinimicrobiota bacterium]MDP6611306.1 biotin--[acetyl-CoA-carboxylase] ligase [Candidatus Neomarinimicrobiota bacterium]|tara:strand:+ start:17775 stop:18542 length:768 start_codon:yes stop_codon:yes gene_type:complete
MLFTNLVQANLKTGIFGQQIEYYTRLESTNSKAWEIIEEGAQSGALVVTDNQFNGKGRGDRNWSAAPDKSLTFSLLLFPDLISNLSGWLPIVSGLAVHNALKNFDTDIKLKWPNDLILGGKKMGGILCESKVKGDQLNQAVIGIGLNVNETMDDFDETLRAVATSMYIYSEKFYQRERVLAEILNALEPLLDGLPNNVNSIKAEWEKACCHMDQPVQFHHGDEIVNGTFKSLGDTGSAMLEINGQEKRFYSGEIS